MMAIERDMGDLPFHVWRARRPASEDTADPVTESQPGSIRRSRDPSVVRGALGRALTFGALTRDPVYVAAGDEGSCAAGAGRRVVGLAGVLGLDLVARPRPIRLAFLDRPIAAAIGELAPGLWRTWVG